MFFSPLYPSFFPHLSSGGGQRLVDRSLAAADAVGVSWRCVFVEGSEWRLLLAGGGIEGRHTQLN